ncbi:MAG: hypothetical protein Kow00127_23540 [Bacteroidales bacterium]
MFKPVNISKNFRSIKKKNSNRLKKCQAGNEVINLPPQFKNRNMYQQTLPVIAILYNVQPNPKMFSMS